MRAKVTLVTSTDAYSKPSLSEDAGFTLIDLEDGTSLLSRLCLNLWQKWKRFGLRLD